MLPSVSSCTKIWCKKHFIIVQKLRHVGDCCDGWTRHCRQREVMKIYITEWWDDDDDDDDDYYYYYYDLENITLSMIIQDNKMIWKYLGIYCWQRSRNRSTYDLENITDIRIWQRWLWSWRKHDQCNFMKVRPMWQKIYWYGMTLRTLWTAERNEDHRADGMTLPLVNDLDSSWRDGILLCLLIDVLCSGCSVNAQELNSTHRLRNCRLALQLANRHLALPPVGRGGSRILVWGGHVGRRRRTNWGAAGAE